MRPHPISSPTLEDFFIVTVVSNTARFHRRYQLYNRFKAMVESSGVKMITVEIAFGDRVFEVTQEDDPYALQLRTVEEFWHKENGINLGIAQGRRVIPGAKFVAWIDADCEPVGRTPRDWFEETWHELQHHELVQMWEWLQPLDYHYAPLGAPNPSFMSNWIKYGTPYPKPSPGYPQQWGSPGLAWAASIQALDRIGQLPDAHILGGGDWWLAHMLISDLPLSYLKDYTPDYRNKFIHQQNLCTKWIKRDVGFVRGLFTHFFHGKTINRGYNTRERILVDGRFAPNKDLKRDFQGLYQLETHSPRQIRMRDRIRQYFRARNEDSIDS